MIPKKSLGQNFLINEDIAEKIAKSAGLTSRDSILEIGPGKGILTKYLAEKAGRFLAVEIDGNLIRDLNKKFKNLRDFHSRPRFTRISSSGDAENIPGGWIPHQVRDAEKRIGIIEGDILRINLPKLIEDNNFQDYKVVANLPYYITSKIIRLLLETKYPPGEMVLMIQKEVGERIVALDGKESILSISVKYYASPEMLFGVPRENFEPAPEVDSAVIRIKRKTNPPETDAGEFFSLVRAGFSSKRKMLANNLSSVFHVQKTNAINLIKKSGLDPKVRAEKLGVEDWIRLSKELRREEINVLKESR
ncbi:MAG: rRNA adenine dimethyltransferase family protein [Parcubacteria group bacterium]|jgi:16S rRNA (adenine1518-N6/adenine1519-N6)-dimethyltransferase